MSFTNGYKSIDQVDSEFWNEAKVNYERIDELYSDTGLKSMLSDLKQPERSDMLKLLKITSNIKLSEIDEFFNLVREHPDYKKLLYLREFLSRKKRAVEELYEKKYANAQQRYDSSDFVKLIHLFYTSPSFLYEVLVVHEWKSKGSGELYNCSDKFTFTLLDGLATKRGYQEKIAETLYNKSKQINKYKIVAHSEMSKDHYIYLMYKLTKDTKRPGFDMAKRVKDIDQLMFSINIVDKIVEIKAPTKTELYGIQQYFKDNVGDLVEIKQEVFTEYSEVALRKVFLEGEPAGGKEPKDFEINKIIFSNSLLSKSPEITIQLPKSDIWLSVMDAFSRRIVDLNSLKDIKQIFFTSDDYTRSVRSVPVGEGNVLFKLDDSSLDASKKKSIMEKFQQKFGFPINQPVENKFKAGESEKIDALLRLSSDEILERSMHYIELRDHGFIQVFEVTEYECPHCISKIELENSKSEMLCPSCSGKVIESKHVEQKIDHDEIEKFVFTLLNSFVKEKQDFDVMKTSSILYRGKRFNVFKFSYEKRPYQCIVSGNILPKKMLEMLERQLIPTLLVYYGVDRETTNVFSQETVQHTTFGTIYTNKDSKAFDEIIRSLVESLDKRSQLLINSAAVKANSALKEIDEQTESLIDYSADMFEDDVFAIIKHLMPNSEKWGKEMRFRPVPEGIFALQYMEQEGLKSFQNKVVFSYDCKLNKDSKGYDLKSDEKRKGLDYINKLNNLKEISTYCTDGQVTAHIFISNKFREGQIQTMTDYFHKEIGSGYIGRPIFITINVLMYLHSRYLIKRNEIAKVPDQFMEALHKMFTSENFMVTKEQVDDAFSDVLYAANQYNELDTNRVTNKLEK